jgi:hypothetical protein
VSACFVPEDKKEFLFQFPIPKGGVTRDELKVEENIITSIYELMKETTDETYTRFSTPRVGVTDDDLYIRLTILPTAPELTYFTKRDDRLRILSSLYKTAANDLEMCARICLQDLNCTSLTFEPTELNCIINPVTRGTLFNYNGLHYVKTRGAGFKARSATDIAESLKDRIRHNQLILNLEITVEQRVRIVPFTCTQITQIEVGVNRYGTTENLKFYNLKYPSTTFNDPSAVQYYDYNVDDCAKACTDLGAFECQSFEFNYVSGECRLSKLVFNGDDDIVRAGSSDVYQSIF